MSFETEDDVERLIAECVERIGREGAAAPDAMVAGHPEHEAALPAGVALGRELGLIGELLPAPAPRRLGDFTLSRFDGASPAARAPLQAELEELRARLDGIE